MYFVYVLQSVRPRGNKNYYIGVTNNLLKRIGEHNSPINRGYTRNNYWRIVYIEAYLKASVARTRERKLKQHGSVWYAVMRRIRHYIGGISY
ncbi:MAG: hypothetical protein Fur003_1980 [Candidatus Dojkabacteria bacterium]